MTYHNAESSGICYDGAWRVYRRSRLFYFALLLGGVPWFFLIGSLTRFHFFSPGIETGLIIFWILIIFYQGWRLALWPCPRCGKAFRGSALFTRTCRYCGLAIRSKKGSQPAH